MKSEMEGIRDSMDPNVEQRLEHIRSQLSLQNIRAAFIQRALAALYIATLLFISSSLAVALNAAYGSGSSSWISSMLALSGGLFLFVASALLLYASRYNLQFINRQIDFIASLSTSKTGKPTAFSI